MLDGRLSGDLQSTLLLCFSSQAPIPSSAGHCRQECFRELAGALAPGPSLRLEVAILTAETQRQVLVMATSTQSLPVHIFFLLSHNLLNHYFPQRHPSPQWISGSGNNIGVGSLCIGTEANVPGR